MAKRQVVMAGACILVSVAFGAGLSFAEPVPPAANQGVSARLVGALDLAGQLASIDHRQLRLRVITIAPGGAMAPHDHKDRPSVEMLVQGKATEFRGGVAKEYKEGDSMVADVATAHWWKNDGDQSAVLVAADIFNPPAK